MFPLRGSKWLRSPESERLWEPKNDEQWWWGSIWWIASWNVCLSRLVMNWNRLITRLYSSPRTILPISFFLLARLSQDPSKVRVRAEWILVVKCKNKHYKSFANAHMEIVSRNLVHEICLHSSFCFVFTLRAQPILFLIARCNVCISHSKHKNALAIKTGKFVDCVCEVDCGSAFATWPVSI